MIPKCLNVVSGMTLGYPTSGTVLGLKGQRSILSSGLGLTAMRRGLDVYECLLVIYTTGVYDHERV